MQLSRTQRIHRGFHRLVAALAGFLIGLAAIALIFDAVWDIDDAEAMLELTSALAMIAIVVYAISRAIGWITTGFAGD